VSKRYGRSVWGLREFRLTVGPGVLGLLGPNGAGKSTLMRIIATVTRPTAGSVSWDGTDLARDPDAVRRVLGYLPQDFGVYPGVSAYDLLDHLAVLKGIVDRGARRAQVDGLLAVAWEPALAPAAQGGASNCSPSCPGLPGE